MSAASEEASDIQGGARPKTKNRNSNQEVPNDNLKDIISLISKKNNSDLSFEELEVQFNFDN